VVNALCPFPFRATLKFGAVSGNPSREGYTISGSNAVTTSPGCQFKLTKSVRDKLTSSTTKYIFVANWFNPNLQDFTYFKIWKYNRISCQRTIINIA